jgi:hypothetical protein
MRLKLVPRLVLLVAQYLVAWNLLRLVHDRELLAAPLLCEREAVIGYLPVPTRQGIGREEMGVPQADGKIEA